MRDIVLAGKGGAVCRRVVDGDGRVGWFGQEDRNDESPGIAAIALDVGIVARRDAHCRHAIANLEDELARCADIAGALQGEQGCLVTGLRQLEVFDAVARAVARPGWRAAQATAAARRVAGRPIDVLVSKDDVEVALLVDLLDADLEGV